MAKYPIPGLRWWVMALKIVTGLLMALALGAPATARAVTVGAPLNLPPSTNSGCEALVYIGPPPPSCTLLGNDISGGWTSQTPRGQWVITTARVRTGPRVGPMTFTVIRATRSQAGAGGLICCSTPVESQVFTPTPNAVNQIPVRLPVKNTVDVIDGEPIETVDYLGISLLDLNSSGPVAAAGNSESFSYIAPAIRQGQERLADGSRGNSRVLVNGEYEPAVGGGGGGGGVGIPGADQLAPALSRLGLTRRRFAAAPRGGSVAAKVGTTIRYRLSEPAAVTFRVQRRKAGRKVKGKCRRRTRSNRRASHCDLTLRGSFRHAGKAGANQLRFTGRLRGRKLARGSYVLTATSKDPAGNVSKVKRARFTIVKR